MEKPPTTSDDSLEKTPSMIDNNNNNVVQNHSEIPARSQIPCSESRLKYYYNLFMSIVDNNNSLYGLNNAENSNALSPAAAGSTVNLQPRVRSYNTMNSLMGDNNASSSHIIAENIEGSCVKKFRLSNGQNGEIPSPNQSNVRLLNYHIS